MWFGLLIGIVLLSGAQPISSSQPIFLHALEICSPAYRLDEEGTPVWIQHGDTLVLPDTTLILKGLTWAPNGQTLAFLGLSSMRREWIVGQIDSFGHLDFLRDFSVQKDELFPSLHWVGDFLAVSWPSRAEAVVLRSNGTTLGRFKPLGDVFLDETQFSILGTSLQNFWIFTVVDSGTWGFYYTNPQGSPRSRFLPYQYFRGAQIAGQWAILSLYQVQRGTPGQFRLTAWAGLREIWEIQSTTEVLIVQSPGNLLIARVADVWQWIDPGTGRVRSAFPVVPSRARVWATRLRDRIALLWQPTRKLDQTCFLWAWPSGEFTPPRCWNQYPSAIPLMKAPDGTWEIHLCSEVYRLR